VTVLKKREHPQKVKLSSAVADDRDAIKARKGLIDKRAALVKTTDGGDDLVSETGATMRPTDEQLERINKFTRKAVTADEVVAFTTLSCNDIPDRDDDRFKTECVKGFAALEQPFSPTGKSYMLDHVYKVENAVGRIFGTDTKKVDSALFLTNEVYVPNTEKNKGFIEDIDFGINWAVSVGVMLGSDECSLSFCKAPFSSWGWWCQNGHDKGLYYTEDAEEDAWGWPTPCDPKTSGAQKCIRDFDDPKDMYELSQVFLGAQYFAALEKTPEFASVMKAAAKGVPIIGLSESESDALPLHKEPRRVTEARMRFGVTENEDGTLKWVDDQKLIWQFDPETDEIGSLGKAATTDNDESEEAPDGEGIEGLVEHDAGDPDQAIDLQGRSVEGDGGGEEQVGGDAEAGGSEHEGGLATAAASDEDDAESGDDDEEDDDSDREPEDDDEDENVDSETDQNVVALATSAGLPAAIIDAAKKASRKNALPAVFAALGAEHKALSEKAAIGETFLIELRAEAIDWYVKAHKSADTVPVKTELFEKILARCGDDVDLIKGLIEENKDMARAKFPQKASRRSSVPAGDDVNERTPAGDIEWQKDDDEKVSRLHS
jgi:hypothetical protein